MNRIYVPTLGPTDWRRLLADPQKQWAPRKSALEMAVCWEAARDTERGIPVEVRETIDSHADLSGATLIVAIPEHQVQLPGGGHASQNDLWALLRTDKHMISAAVEAKAGEPLAELVRDWLPRDNDPSRARSGKPRRLEALQTLLGVPGEDVSFLRYQLLHRAASALIEAERFRADLALLLVQSFNELADEESWQDFARFARLMGATVQKNAVVRSPRQTAVPFYLGWVQSQPAGLDRFRAGV